MEKTTAGPLAGSRTRCSGGSTGRVRPPLDRAPCSVAPCGSSPQARLPWCSVGSWAHGSMRRKAKAPRRPWSPVPSAFGTNPTGRSPAERSWLGTWSGPAFVADSVRRPRHPPAAAAVCVWIRSQTEAPRYLGGDLRLSSDLRRHHAVSTE